jgi:hypothetical protein
MIAQLFHEVLSLHIHTHANYIVLCEDRNKKLDNRINVGFTYSIKGKVVPTHAMKVYKAMGVQNNFSVTSALSVGRVAQSV